MAALAREDGPRSQEQGRRGCEHYDRGCLLKVTSLGSSSTSFRRAGLGVGWSGHLGWGQSLRLSCLIGFFSTWNLVPAVEKAFGKASIGPTLPPGLYFASGRPCLGRAWVCTLITSSGFSLLLLE